jgi:exopolyphosphatase/guanosine-5'-triphosphate,3'-diphosphate pyrophosphatase
MGEIVPRWEWRTFGPGVDVAEAAFEAMEPTGVQESDETYVLATGGRPATVKIRAGLLDIKEFVATDPAGLQQWRPVMKAEFPLSADEIRSVFAAFGLEAPSLAREAYSLDELAAALSGPGTGLRLVAVHKRRVRYVVNGCTSEVTNVTADGIPSRTIAIESPDAAAVVEAVRSVGLGSYLNTSYGPGLAWILDGSPERYAVIDAGTNSIKFHIAERVGERGWRTIIDRAEITRLGEGIDGTGDIAPQAIERTATAIAGMAAEARQAGALALVAVGTAGLRIANNSGAVRDAIRERSGVDIEVIAGDDEARLAYLAVMAALGMDAGSLAVFDTGGGSTQLTFGHGDVVDERFSVNVGAVRYTERFGLSGPVSREVLAEAMAAIAADLQRLDGRGPVDALVGMGGAVTNLTAVRFAMTTYDPDVVQGAVLDRAEIDRQIERYRTTELEARRSIPGLQPDRAEVILAGACVVRTVMDKLGQDSLTVSDRGLRHGVLVERFGTTPTTREGALR